MKNILFLILIIAFGCTNDNSVNTNDSSNLTIYVVDNFNKPVGKAFINLSHVIGNNSASIYSDSTDVNGVAKIGKVLEGDYYATCKVKVNGILYNSYEGFQVVNNSNKDVYLYPMMNVMDYGVLVQNSKGENLVGINVAFLSHPHGLPDYSPPVFGKLINNAYWIKKTDSSGLVEFNNVPIGFSYSALIFWDSTKFEYPSTSMSPGSSPNPQVYKVNL